MVSRDSRRYPPRPILGIGALIFDGDRILLIERGREPLKGQWSLPGGAVETGETIEEAVAREVREETGLTVKPLQIAAVFERIFHDSAGAAEYHYLLIDFICEVREGQLCAGDDCSRAAWYSLADLDSVPLTEGTLKVIKQVREYGPSLTILRP